MINSIQLEGLTYVKMLKPQKKTDSEKFNNILNDKIKEDKVDEDKPQQVESKYTNPEDLVCVDSPSSLEKYFQEAADTYGVPIALIKAVAKAESNFNTQAVSSAGAQGVMQLMPGTAQGLGVEDPFDARENIMGGTKLLARNLTKYNGSVKLALAAYNAGPGNVAKYNGVPPFKETTNYIKKIFGYLGVDLEKKTENVEQTNASSGSQGASSTTATNKNETEKLPTADEIADAIIKKLNGSGSASNTIGNGLDGSVDYKKLISQLSGSSTYGSILSNVLK